LQKDVDQNQIVDVRGLSKVNDNQQYCPYCYRNRCYLCSSLTSQVEARIVVLSVLRKIKEQYLLGNVEMSLCSFYNRSTDAKSLG
jgi:hypothetical protein